MGDFNPDFNNDFDISQIPLATKTARDFIILALKEAGILGVGQTPLAEDTNDCFTLLQRMTAQWQKRRWMVPGLQVIGNLGNSQISNKIGIGQFWNTPRPDKIQGAYFIQNTQSGTPVSLPLSACFSYEDYIKITVKNLNTFPEYFFYDGRNQYGNNPTDGSKGYGNVFIWPIPDPTYTIFLLIKSQLGWPITLNNIFTLPDE